MKRRNTWTNSDNFNYVHGCTNNCVIDECERKITSYLYFLPAKQNINIHTQNSHFFWYSNYPIFVTSLLVKVQKKTYLITIQFQNGFDKYHLLPGFVSEFWMFLPTILISHWKVTIPACCVWGWGWGWGWVWGCWWATDEEGLLCFNPVQQGIFMHACMSETHF